MFKLDQQGKEVLNFGLGCLLLLFAHVFGAWILAEFPVSSYAAIFTIMAFFIVDILLLLVAFAEK